MIARCTNEKNPNYKYYGGRGIKVCEEWFDFYNFGNDMYHEYSNRIKLLGDKKGSTTLDRIDNNGNYCKENCQWIDIVEQQKNRRKVIFRKVNPDCLHQLCIKNNIKYDTVRKRIKNGWTKEMALNHPLQKRTFVK